jgi:glyoxylase-like metal-dependent hydrolase (beta-lactamase superfamily II)
VSLHVRQSRFLSYNAGAFVSHGEACLVDPGILATEIDALAAELGGADAATVVLTHSDWDHVLGPEHLPEATVIAHSAYTENLDPHGIRVVLAKLEEQAGVQRNEPFEPPRPDETLDDELVLLVGELELRVEHAPGHTADMVTVYDPPSATLWAADMLSDIELPLICHDLGAYERTLARLVERDIDVLVPGHGTPSHERRDIRRRLDEDRRYLEELRSAVSESVSAGRSLDEAIALLADPPAQRSLEDVEVHRLNVEKVYADLGGDADPAAVGYVRVWQEATRA